MGQLIVIALVAAAAWWGWRTWRRGADRIARERALGRRGVTTLEKDPATGVYHAPKRDER